VEARGRDRRFRRFYDEEGKGNGKSPMLAGIGLYCMLADGEARAEVYAAGSKKDQAMVLFRDAVAMRDQSPALSARLTKSGGNPVWNLADLTTGSFFRPISSDDGQSGPRPSCALCDEVHEHRNGTVIELLERGFKFRRQPLLAMATNSGSDRNSVCWQEHQHAVRCAAGTRSRTRPSPMSAR
jgi:phage terminase large subunit-like protein